MSSDRSSSGHLSLYDSTYSLYRVSPLHFAGDSPQSPAGLRRHSRSLRDALTGDSLRGVRAEIEQDDGQTRAGTLQSCQWKWSDGNDRATSIDGFGACEGIQVDVDYEKATYRALLLRARPAASEDHSNELHLPLLLVRMPAALRQLFFDYISATFDAKVEAMLIPKDGLAQVMDDFLFAAGSGGSETLQDIVRQVQLSLGSRVPTLRSMDITISQEDVPQFIKRGRTATNRPGAHSGPFFASLADYLSEHLAMNIDHEDLSLSRVACGAFALGSEGRVKIFAPGKTSPSAEATTALLRALLARSTPTIPST